MSYLDTSYQDLQSAVIVCYTFFLGIENDGLLNFWYGAKTNDKLINHFQLSLIVLLTNATSLRHGRMVTSHPYIKKDDKSAPSNYRPITLRSSVGKTMERCVHKRLYNYAIEHRILTPLQSGFIQGDSTTYQLLHTYHNFCEAIDNGKEIRVVFCDISKAFDRVWHRGLLHKLRAVGCSDKVTEWVASYLSDRRQRVVINGQTSEWEFIFAGVPQGSFLGPLLFLIFINAIVKNIGASICLFADDTSLYIIVETPTTAAMILNGDLHNISDWADFWLVNFNAANILSMVISRKVNKPIHPPLFMNNTQINETQTHKLLGITFSSSCLWPDHIGTICEKNMDKT